ncbi:MAG: hypothetical protein JWQ40_4385 [Segetibacter sp.]|nr:hypothetical protein [Segetibacter sp.]
MVWGHPTSFLRRTLVRQKEISVFTTSFFVRGFYEVGFVSRTFKQQRNEQINLNYVL